MFSKSIAILQTMCRDARFPNGAKTKKESNILAGN